MSKSDPKVPKYVPTKEHIKNVLLFYFRLKKDASEVHDKIKETYGAEHAVPLSYCEHWYKRFEGGDFSLEEDDDTALQVKEETS